MLCMGAGAGAARMVVGRALRALILLLRATYVLPTENGEPFLATKLLICNINPPRIAQLNQSFQTSGPAFSLPLMP